MTSPHARTLVSRIGEVAGACAPDHIDLVAHVDTASEGTEALALALARLAAIARNLVEEGFPAERLRVIAQPSASASAGLHQIDVVFSKSDAAQLPADAGRTSAPAITLRSDPV
jgi:hypothetical protein